MSRPALVASIVAVIILCALIVLTHEGRELHLTVAEQMTWECSNTAALLPSYSSFMPRGAPIIIFHFVQAPEERDWQGDPDGSFCRSLQQGGKPIVTLVSDVTGNRWQGWYGFRELTIDGRPWPLYPPLGGFGGSPMSHPEPFAEAFNHAYNRH